MAMRLDLAAALVTVRLGSAQWLVNPTDRAKFNSLFDTLKGEPLSCNVKMLEPRVDFAFRFELRYIVTCELGQFGESGAVLSTFLRVKPENGAEVTLGDRYGVDGLPQDARKISVGKRQGDLEFSEALAAGAGVYTMNLLVLDNRNRLYRRRWKVKAIPRGNEGKLNFSMEPSALAPLRATSVAFKPKTANGPRLTVLMNAAPIDQRSTNLRAWDRAFLLDSLASLLRELPYSLVRVVAFNLEQQHEIYRQDDFGEGNMRGLARSLRSFEMGKVSYQTLERQQGWAELLLALLKKESQAKEPAGAVVFLGPVLRLQQKAPVDLLSSYGSQTPPLFCVSYYSRVGADFPDSVQRLTAALKGKVFRIHTPGDLAQNLEKLKREIARGN